MRVNDVLALDVLDQVELLQRRYNIIGLDCRHIAQILYADGALGDERKNIKEFRINFQRMNVENT